MGNIIKPNHQRLFLDQSHNHWVNLQNKRLGDEGMKSIGLLSADATLQLNLNKNNITSIGIANIIAVKPSWKKLIDIRLYQNRIGNNGCKLLTKIGMPTLEYLSLGKNTIGSEGLLHLSKSQWKHLKKINLILNKLGTHSIKFLIQSDWKIGVLFFQYNKLTPVELILLVLSPWKKLQMLAIDQNNICLLFDQSTLRRISSFTGKEVRMFI